MLLINFLILALLIVLAVSFCSCEHINNVHWKRSLNSTSVAGHGRGRRGRLRQPGGGLGRRQLGGVDLPSGQLVPADRRQTALPRLHSQRPGSVLQRPEAAAVTGQVSPSRRNSSLYKDERTALGCEKSCFF